MPKKRNAWKLPAVAFASLFFLFVFTFYIIFFKFSYSCSSKATAPTPTPCAWCTDWKTVIRLMHLFAACHKNAQHTIHTNCMIEIFSNVFFFYFRYECISKFFLFVLSLFMQQQQQRFIFYGDKNYNAQTMKFIRLRRRSQNITVNEMPI